MDHCSCRLILILLTRLVRTLQRSKELADEKPIGGGQRQRRGAQIRTEIEQRTVEVSGAGRHVDETHERAPLATVKSNLSKSTAPSAPSAETVAPGRCNGRISPPRPTRCVSLKSGVT